MISRISRIQDGGFFQLNPLVTTCRLVNSQSNPTIQTNWIIMCVHFSFDVEYLVVISLKYMMPRQTNSSKIR